MSERRFRCTRAWARNKVGDIVENYMMKRYPSDIRNNNFVEIFPEEKKTKSTVNTKKTLTKKDVPK